MISPLLDAIVDRALAEDLSAGDVTSEALVPEHTRASADDTGAPSMVKVHSAAAAPSTTTRSTGMRGRSA